LGEKFEPVEVNPRACPDADRESHLQAFVSSFIVKSRRDRCLHILLESPSKARRELHHIDRWLDPNLSRELDGSSGFPGPLEATLGSNVGVYFDDSLRSHLLTPAEAATLATVHAADGILSLVPGKRALVFHHEGAVYLCERK
jgi:hypothetical protein